MTTALLDGRVALVTGGARGIGLAVATTLHALGASVVIADAGVGIGGDDADPDVAARAASALGERAASFAGDLAEPGNAEAAVALALERFGAIDLVVNNAAILRDGFIFKTRRDDWQRVLEIEPDNARVWNSKGALLTELGRAEEALACLNRALELSSSDAKIKSIFLLNKGKALFILKRYREAREALVRSHQFDPSPESAAGITACREQIELAATSSVASPA